MKTFYLIDVENDVAKRVNPPEDAEKFLDWCYETMSVDCITYTYVKIKGKEYEVIADDEGLLKSNFKESVIQVGNKYPLIVGNIIICGEYNYEEEANESLTEEDIANIEDRLMRTIIIGEGSHYVLRAD